MIKSILPLSLCTVALLFFACEKESDTTSISVNTPSDNPTVYITQSVLFQYEYQNPDTKERFGWFIDRYGNVKSYELGASTGSSIQHGRHYTLDELDYFISQAETASITISREELQTKFQRIAQVNDQLTDRVDDDSQSAYWTFRAFKNLNTDGNQQCGNDYHTTQNEEILKVLLLKSAGAISQENTSTAAQDLTLWLENIKSQVGL